MGGFLTAALAAEAPEKFAGISLIVPFFYFYDDKPIKGALPIAKVLNLFMPAYQLKLMQNDKCPNYF